MNDGTPLDYVQRLEAALFEYVEKYGASEAVRNLFRASRRQVSNQTPASEKGP